MAYEDFDKLTRRTASNKILPDRAFNFAKNLKYDGYQRGLGSMVYKLFGKKVSGGAATLVWSEALATRNKSGVKNENN